MPGVKKKIISFVSRNSFPKMKRYTSEGTIITPATKTSIKVNVSFREPLVLAMDSSLLLLLTTSEYKTTAILLVMVQMASEKVTQIEKTNTLEIP